MCPTAGESAKIGSVLSFDQAADGRLDGWMDGRMDATVLSVQAVPMVSVSKVAS